MTEPVLMRVVGGAELSTLATGVESGVTQVLPPCPREVAIGVGEAVLEHRGPLTDPLVAHGPKARRRAWIRQLVTASTSSSRRPSPPGGSTSRGGGSRPSPSRCSLGAAAVGESSYRHLGHALAGDHLVAGSGALARIRTVLETDGIIGWVVRSRGGSAASASRT